LEFTRFRPGVWWPFVAAAFACAPVACGAESLSTNASRQVGAGDAGGGVGAAAGMGADASADASGVFPVCSDGQILSILAAECAARVNIAGAVRAGLVSAGAVDLADKLFTDDSVLGVEVQGEIRETGIAADPGGIDRAIAAEASGAIQALGAESGSALDDSYVDREVLAHVRALGLIDQVLAPSARDPRVADLLARVRAVIAQDAQAATAAQSELEGACADNAD
jgi:predicted outer membrane protein